jgi:hypothetical protein
MSARRPRLPTPEHLDKKSLTSTITLRSTLKSSVSPSSEKNLNHHLQCRRVDIFQNPFRSPTCRPLLEGAVNSEHSGSPARSGSGTLDLREMKIYFKSVASDPNTSTVALYSTHHSYLTFPSCFNTQNAARACFYNSFVSLPTCGDSPSLRFRYLNRFLRCRRADNLPRPDHFARLIAGFT